MGSRSLSLESRIFFTLGHGGQVFTKILLDPTAQMRWVLNEVSSTIQAAEDAANPQAPDFGCCYVDATNRHNELGSGIYQKQMDLIVFDSEQLGLC